MATGADLRRKKKLDTPAKVALFVSVFNAARCPADAAKLLGCSIEEVRNMADWCRRKKLPLKRFRAPFAGGVAK